MKKLAVLILAIVGVSNVSAQVIDTIEVNDINKSRKIDAFNSRNLMYKIVKGKSSINALVELSVKEIDGNLIYVRSTKLPSGEVIDSIIVDAQTLQTKQIVLKNGKRDSLQIFDFSTKNIVKLSKNFDTSFIKETQISDNTFCALLVNELFKKISVKENTTYVIKNYNPYSNKTDYQKLTTLGKEKIELIGGVKIDAWKLELTQGKFIYRIWLETKTNELIKQVSIFPNGVEYWESRVY